MAHTINSTYENIELERWDYPNGTMFQSIAYGTGDWLVNIGECVAISFGIVQDVHLDIGDNYIYNPHLFATNGYTTPINPNLLGGWLIECNDTTINAQLPVTFLGGNDITQQNQSVTARVLDAHTITVKHTFYVTASHTGFMGSSFFPNAKRWLVTNAVSTTDLDNTLLNTTYRNQWCGIELCTYQVDTNLLPVTTGSIYVRDSSNPFYNVQLLDIQTRFYDSTLYETNYLSRVALLDVFDNSIFIAVAPIAGVTDNLPHDTNYQTIGSPNLNFQGKNTVRITINANDFNAGGADGTKSDYIVLRLIDCTKTNFQNVQNWYDEYLTDAITVPYGNDNTVFPNALTNHRGQPSAFSTPYDFLNNGDLRICIDGSKLQYGHEYRIIVALYKLTVPRVVSTHITPALLINDLYVPSLPLLDGQIKTYNATHNTNYLQIAPCERVRVAVNIDTQGDLSTVSDMVLAECKSTTTNQLGSIVHQSTATYDLQQGLSNGVDFINSYPVWSFSRDLRAYFDILTSTGNASTIHQWRFVFAHQNANGSTQTYEIQYTQVTDIRPLDTTRIAGIKFLQYDDFQAGTLTYLQAICSTDTRVVVEIEKNGLPNANLIALFTDLLNGTGIQEEENYTGLLPIATSAILDNVDATFTSNKAYYVLNINQLQTNALLFGTGALIYDI